MSEEEIISYVEQLLGLNYVQGQPHQAIQGLLDLYNKEKEKNEKYKKSNKLYYIHKDKIRELLNKYDKDIAWANADDHYYFVRYIKELLGEKEREG